MLFGLVQNVNKSKSAKTRENLILRKEIIAQMATIFEGEILIVSLAYDLENWVTLEKARRFFVDFDPSTNTKLVSVFLVIIRGRNMHSRMSF